jgi:hypothetical protein
MISNQSYNPCREGSLRYCYSHDFDEFISIYDLLKNDSV